MDEVGQVVEGGVEPRTTFDWVIYADATLAGLALLIPVPLLDVFVEWLFRRRIPVVVARRNGRRLDKQTLRLLRADQLDLGGCLTAPLALLLLLLKRIYRTVLYFLTVKEATDNLSEYWHQAFLLDYMVRRGDLETPEQTAVAARAMRLVLEQHETSPMNRLALEIVEGMTHVLRTAWRWLRRKREDAELSRAHQQMEESWAGFGGYLNEVAAQYAHLYAQLWAEEVARQQGEVGGT